MSNKPFKPSLPYIEPPDEETIEKIKNMDLRKFRKSYAFKKYVQPVLDREKRQKADKRKRWWKDNLLNLATFIVAILTLIATIVLGLLGLFR